MTGAEGGVGPSNLKWKPFWLTMLCITVVMIALVTLGEWLGILH